MDRTAPEHLAPPADPAPARHTALAFDARLANPRPVFTLTHELAPADGGGWTVTRTWRAVGPDVLAVERSTWRDRLVRVDGDSPTLGERVQAVVEADGSCRTTLASHRTGGQARERRLALPHEAVTLASLPLLAARHWSRLVAGGTVDASYLVLKVQRAATVRLAAEPPRDGRRTVVATPRNPLLRAIFGSTRLGFDADAPRLHRIDGLLDPRDLRSNGRWREYLGTIAFDAPVDLSALAGAGDAR